MKTIIYCPGGHFFSKSPDRPETYAVQTRFFKRFGYDFVPIQYGPEVNLMDDLNEAFNKTLDHRKTSADQVYLWGVSRGGYLSYHLMEATSVFTRAVICVAPFDLSSWKPPAKFAEYFRMDPARLASDIQTPILLVYGYDDDIVPHNQGDLAQKAIKAPTELIKVPLGHNLTSKPAMLGLVKRWFDRKV